MRIKISKEAEEYIKQRGKEVFILIGSIGGCCGGSMPMPYIYIGKPKELYRYKAHEIGNIIVYIDKSIQMNKEIQINLSKFLWLKQLIVDLI